MKEKIIEFIKSSHPETKNGIINLKNRYYIFSQDNKTGNTKIFEISDEMFKEITEFYINCVLDSFAKYVKGCVHNMNGMLTPIYSRAGMLKTSTENTDNNMELKMIHRAAAKIENIINTIVANNNITQETLNTYIETKVKDTREIKAEIFYSGLEKILVTDLFIKHQFTFTKHIDPEIKIKIPIPDFLPINIFIILSLSKVIEKQNLVKETTAKMEITLIPEDKKIIFKCEFMPVEEQKETMDWYELQSFILFEKAKILAKNNELTLTLKGDSIELTTIK